MTLYRNLPPSAKSVAASMRGMLLRASRYGPETQRLAEEALDRETWNRERLETWQNERVERWLHRAATRVPFYREMWARRRRLGDRRSWDVIENWPVLEKESVRQHPHAFVSDDCDIRTMLSEHTSGTTGTPLQLWRSRDAVRALYALSEARERGWYGVSVRDRWAMLGGQPVISVRRRKPPFWVWNRALNQLYMSSYHLAPDLVRHYLDALRRYRVTYLWGYSSALYVLAQEALRLGCRDLRMTVAITNGEPLFDYQRQAVAEAFQCPVRETYGMAEMVVSACECEAGKLHLWPEVGKVEILEDDAPVPAGTTGDVVCTGLLNSGMPLVRYRVGDRASLPTETATCACGRNLPQIGSIDGRVDETLYTTDGRRIVRLASVLDHDLPLEEAQIVQKSLEHILVRVVPCESFRADHEDAIVERLRERMGPVQVSFERVREIPRTARGKFRKVVCELPDDVLHQVGVA